jgi:hypothetical protein
MYIIVVIIIIIIKKYYIKYYKFFILKSNNEQNIFQSEFLQEPYNYHNLRVSNRENTRTIIYLSGKNMTALEYERTCPTEMAIGTVPCCPAGFHNMEHFQNCALGSVIHNSRYNSASSHCLKVTAAIKFTEECRLLVVVVVVLVVVVVVVVV